VTRRYSRRRNAGPRKVKNPSVIPAAWSAAAAAASAVVPVRSTMPVPVLASIAIVSERLGPAVAKSTSFTVGDVTASQSS
jgi:hypothetical protein